jgi:biopolymer transport protein ExbB
MNTSALVDLAGTGATYVLYLLVALSTIQVALVIERVITFRRSRAPRQLRTSVRDALASNSAPALALAVTADRSLEGKVMAVGAAAAIRGPEAMEQLMGSALAEERLHLERGLSFLGTVGNNAPFVGLFGTVLGIIHATAELSTAQGRAGASVMAGISEALVSTAVGLVVALPAVAAYNYFQRAIQRRVVAAESLSSELLAHVKAPIARPSRKVV